jgi:hypothetical protein
VNRERRIGKKEDYNAQYSGQRGIEDTHGKRENRVRITEEKQNK